MDRLRDYTILAASRCLAAGSKAESKQRKLPRSILPLSAPKWGVYTGFRDCGIPRSGRHRKLKFSEAIMKTQGEIKTAVCE